MAKTEPPVRLEPSKVTKRAFFDEFQRLTRDFTADAGNPSSYACKECERCTACMFCEGCANCYRCTHCEGCRDCSECSHSVECVSCHTCAYCVQSELCVGSAYLTLSRNCADCTYCFGCVGLSRKDFHILNQPYSRKDYFDLVKKLKVELGIA
jgi:hypothetical protein